MQPVADPTPAFRTLERALVRRRFQSLEPLLRVEIAAIGTLCAGFVFWKTRLPLAAAFARGALWAVLIEESLRLLGLAIAAGALAGIAHRRGLAGALAGPAWLALPLPAARVHRHLAWASGLHALWVMPFAIGMLAAGAGLVPAGWLLLLAAGFVWATLEAARAGTAIAFRLARRAQGLSQLDLATRVLAQAARATPKRHLAPARWLRLPVWRALMAKDAWLATRPGAVRDRLPAPLLCALVSLALWVAPVELGVAHVASFVLLLVAAGLWGMWVIAACGSDPSALLRALPVGLRDVWGARARWALIGALGLSALAAMAIVRLPASVAVTEGAFMAVAAGAVGGLAVNYGVSLFPRAVEAERLFALALAISLGASLMIPLLGWIVLLVALVHSSRRVARWSLLENV